MKRFLLLLSSLTLLYAGAYSLTLTEAVEEALKGSPQIRIQEENVKVADLDRGIAVTSLLPKISASGTYVYLDSVPTTETMTAMGLTRIQVGVQDNWSATVQLSQPIFMGGRLINAYLISNDKKKIAMYDLDKSRQDVKMAVIQLYLSGLLTEKMAEMYANIQESSLEHLSTSKKRYDLGNISRLEYLAAKTQYESNKPKLESARNALKSIKNSLKLIMGRDMKSDFEFEGLLDTSLIEEFSYDIPLLDADTLYKKAEGSRTDIKSMKTTLDMMKKLEAMNYMAFLPTVAGFVQYKYANAYSVYGDSIYYDGTGSVGVSASIDIFQSGKRVMDVLKTKHQYKQASVSYSMLKSSLESQIENLLNTYESSSSSVASMDAAFKTAEEAYRTSKEQYASGLINNGDYLDAESNYISAQVGYAKSVYDMVISYFSLVNAIGIL